MRHLAAGDWLWEIICKLCWVQSLDVSAEFRFGAHYLFERSQHKLFHRKGKFVTPEATLLSDWPGRGAVTFWSLRDGPACVG